MANPSKPKEGLPFGLYVAALALGTLWISAGGDLDAFSHIGEVLGRGIPTSSEDVNSRVREILRIPHVVKVPAQRLIPPAEIAQAKEMMAKAPGARPPLAQIGGEGKRNPFFPEWVRDLLQAGEVTVLLPGAEGVGAAGSGPGGLAKGGKGPGGKGAQAQKVVEDRFVFSGIVKIKQEPPAALLRDVSKNLSVFLRQGERYGQIHAVEVKVDGATFAVAGGQKHTFDTLHGTNKTFTVRR